MYYTTEFGITIQREEKEVRGTSMKLKIDQRVGAGLL